jgi:hypothetical protein
MDKPARLRPDTRPRRGQVMWRAGQSRCRVRRGGGAGPRLRYLPPALTRQSPTREPEATPAASALVRRLVPGWRRPSSPPVSGAGRCCSPMRALTTSTTPARVGIARCSGLGWRWAVATFSGCRHWGRRHPWTRTAPSGRAGPQHQQARPPQRPWRYAGAPDGRVGQPGLPAPLGTNPLRTHPFAPYGRQRPGKTAVRTALSPRYLIRMRSQVQVLAGPPTNPAGQGVAVLEPAALSVSLVHIWSTSCPTRHHRPPYARGPDGPATPGPTRGTDARNGPR